MSLHPFPMPATIPHFGDLTAWHISTNYAVGQRVAANGNVYQCTIEGFSSGVGTGPSGTGGAIVDGSVTWAYQVAASTAWAGGTVYAAGDVVTNDGGKIYSCITAGTSDLYGTGPTGTAGVITDGTVTWTYAGSVVALTTAPTSRTADSGAVPGSPFFAQYFNYIWTLVVYWLYYLRDLTKQSLQWQNTHQFTNEDNQAIAIIDCGVVQQSGRETRGGFDWMGFLDYPHFWVLENWLPDISTSTTGALWTNSPWFVETNGGVGAVAAVGSADLPRGVSVYAGQTSAKDLYVMLGQTNASCPIFTTAAAGDDVQASEEIVATLHRLGAGALGLDTTISIGFSAAGAAPAFPTANGKQIAFRKKTGDTNWHAVVGDGTGETDVDTLVPPTENVYQRFRVEYQGASSPFAAKTCRFFIDDSLVATIATHIATNQSMRLGFGCRNTNGATSVTEIIVGPSLTKYNVPPGMPT